MQIRIEIDVKPEELRRFLGLPDVAGLQEDIIAYLRDKVGDANENFRPGDFVRTNFDTLRKSKAWRRLMDGVEAVEAEEREQARKAAAASAKKSARKRNSAGKSRGAKSSSGQSGGGS
jgi:hypothetical protein